MITVPSRAKMNNAFDPSKALTLPPHLQDQIARRSSILGPAYRLFYENPLEIVRGRGTRLWDADENEYLDAYNNVVSVGHAHPYVVEAVHRQMQTLCTHTRYMHDGILRYAEQLLATFEDSMRTAHVMFTCTGSEANDLALRIAQHHTGNRGIIVTSEAYHGNSSLTAGFSPSLGIHSPLGTHVRQVPAPDSYRLAHETMGQWLADQVQAQIDDLERHGEKLAAFVVDSAFSSDGIYSHPTGIFKLVADVVRNAGGLFIADEVQSGFARLGDKMWGFERHDIEPDIVTMGKPMGNGYPVAAIVVQPDIIARFGNDMRYFNTFGGNTVAIAAAQATLEVMQSEGLRSNAMRVGSRLKQGLREIQTDFEAIGDVRGSGLYIGVEMVRDREAKIPDTALAVSLVNRLRERRVLISATGDAGNILKIRPPLPFTDADADLFLNVFRDVMAQSRSQSNYTAAPSS